MGFPFPYEVVKRKRPFDEEELRAWHHEGKALIAVVQTTADTDPSGPRYWHYFRVPGDAGR